jgi:hypothetical protein
VNQVTPLNNNSPFPSVNAVVGASELLQYNWWSLKLKRLSAATQEALKQLACLGNVAEITTLSLVHGTTEEAMHAALWEAVHAGLVFRADRAYKFLHDRIQQAAHALMRLRLRPFNEWAVARRSSVAGGLGGLQIDGRPDAIGLDVSVGSKPELERRNRYFRFTPESRH